MSQKCLALFASVAKSKFLKIIYFDLREEEGKNFSGVLVTVADCERNLELQKRKLGKEKEGLILQNHNGMFARYPEITLLRSKD